MDESKNKKNPLLRLLAFLVTLALVLGAVFLVANWQKLNFDSVKRYFAYRALAKNENGQVESFPYVGGADSVFALVDNDLLVASTSGVRLYSSSGGTYIDQSQTIENPAVSVSGGRALVYDAGGMELHVYEDHNEIFSYTAQTPYAILSASLSAQGWLTIVTQAGGLKGAVSVYDANFQPALDVNLSSRFITNAILSPDSKTLALATSGQTGGLYDSQISFYALSRADGDDEPDAVCSLGSTTVLALRWTQEALRVLEDSQLAFVSAEGTLDAVYSYDRRYLKGFALNEDGSSALLLGKYRAGSSAELVSVDAQGGELAVRPLAQQVLSLSAAGRYVSILTAGELTIYTGQDLEVYHTTNAIQSARRVLQRDDGSVTLISGETARLYLPD